MNGPVQGTGGPGHPLTVGGPGGIQITNESVSMGYQQLTGAPVPAPIYPPQHPLGLANGPQPSFGLADASSVLARHPRVVGAAVAAFGLATMIGPGLVLSYLALPWVFWVAPLMVGTTLLFLAAWIASRTRPAGAMDPIVERRLLDAAVRNRGRLTVAVAAREAGLTLDEADANLGHLARRGHATIENDSTSGAVVYAFPDLVVGQLR